MLKILPAPPRPSRRELYVQAIDAGIDPMVMQEESNDNIAAVIRIAPLLRLVPDVDVQDADPDSYPRLGIPGRWAAPDDLGGDAA